MVRSLINLALQHPDGVLSSSRFEIFMCPSCPNAHIVMFDEDGMPFAQMTVGPTQLQVINDGCRDVFEEKGVWDKDSKGIC